MLDSERAKLAIVAADEKRADQFKVVAFDPAIDTGFGMVVLAPKAGYKYLISTLFEAGLEPELKRADVRDGDSVYDVFVAVPKGWRYDG